jgi:two-component system sensor kinase FixL
MIGECEDSAGLFRAVIDTSPDAIIVIDASGAVRLLSPAAERLFGYAESEVLGQNVKVLAPPHFREQHDQFITHYLATGEKRIIGIGRVVAGRRKDGSSFPMELFVGEATRAGERLFVGFVRDLSSRDREHRRAQQLQAKLYHVSRLGEMGQMASGLAHEITQPLGAIMNYVNAARRSAAMAQPATANEVLDKISEQARRAVEIVRRLRSFVAMSDIHKEHCDLHVLIEEAVALAALGPTARSVRIDLRLMPRSLPVTVDRVQIQQVLVNLLRNSIDAMLRSSRREITISTRLDEEDVVFVSVSDTGPGVEPDLVSQLFEAFVTSKADGLGIGLSISKTIIEAHGGRIWFTPNPDVGASFHFTLPSGGEERGKPAGDAGGAD